MTLHEAIEKVLMEAGRPMTTTEIADAIASRDLYRRGDGAHAPASQISARINSAPYMALFSRENGKVRLKGITLRNEI